MNSLNKKNYHRYFGFLKVVLFQILLFLIYPSVSYAWVGHENAFTFWEAIYVFGIMFSLGIAIFLIFKIIFHFFVFIIRDKLGIKLWYTIIPILILLYIYIFEKIDGDTKILIFKEMIVIIIFILFTMTPIMAFIIALSKCLKRKLSVISFVSKQKKVNPKVLIWILDVFLFFVSSVIIGGILFLLLFIWTSFANYIGF